RPKLAGHERRHWARGQLPPGTGRCRAPASQALNERGIMTLYLDEPRTRALLRMEELIPAMERALIAFSAGEAVVPVRSSITGGPPGGVFLLMPAPAEGLGVETSS